MRQNTFLKSIVIFSMVSLLLAPALAAEETQKMAPAVGDWLLTSDFNGRSVNSLMMISKDSGGKYQGSWVSFWGINKIDDLKIQGG